MATPLPQPRALLTSLINSLPPGPFPSVSEQDVVEAATTRAAANPINQLKNIPASARQLLTTLHVLLVPGQLWQALDLLDRGLVTRILGVFPPSVPNHSAVVPTQAHIHLPGCVEQDGEIYGAGESAKKERIELDNTFYAVRSAQGAKGKGSKYGGASGHASAGTGLSYVVRLQAWNCSCAAFTFSAFPATMSPFVPTYCEGDGRVNSAKMQVGKERTEAWQFGGLSRDGMDDRSSVPCCKHLLACLLAERWHLVLGCYVKEIMAESEEMAGLGADG